MFNPIEDWLLQRGLAAGATAAVTTAAEIALVVVLAAIADAGAKRVVVAGRDDRAFIHI